MVTNKLSFMAKKLATLHLHHIDTSVLLEPRTTENGFCCKKYLNIVGIKYKGVISFPVLSEIMYKILSLTDISSKYDLVDDISSIIKSKKIAIQGVRNTEEIVIRIRELDKSITPNDRLIIASAVVNKASALVTLDSRLIGNQPIEKEFKIRMLHPKQLL